MESSPRAAAPYAGPGLYVHIPFCSAICPYCDFSVLLGGTKHKQSFLDHLLMEIEAWAGPVRELFQAPFDTLYLGGGTPSALPPEELERLFDSLARHLPLHPLCWVHLEANPEDVDARTLAAWRRLGARTLCLGIQSFDPASLSFLGRRHSPAQGRRAVEMALEAGFDTVSVDLIYGLPGQSPAAWRRELGEAATLGPQHISCYQLTIHQGTPFGFRRDRGLLQEMPEEEQAELFLLTHEGLESLGYAAYEVSSFAVGAEHQSRHNSKYWRHVPYLGLGPSAHSFAGGRRWWNERKVGPYQRRLASRELPVAGEESLDPRDLALEHLLLGLRTRAGIDLSQIEARCGLELRQANRQRIADSIARGLLVESASRLLPTRQGLAMADALAAAFEIPGPEHSRSAASTANIAGS